MTSQNQQEAQNIKNEANKLFKEGHFSNAIDAYTRALEHHETAILYANRALAHIKMENFGSAILDAKKAIELDPEYIKGYYRRGSALLALGHYEKALVDFKDACKREPKNRDARNKYTECLKAVKAARFEKAIATPDAPHSVIPSLNLEHMDVPESYEGPRFEEELTLTFAKEMMQWFKDRKVIHKKYAYKILVMAKEFLEKEKSLVDITIKDKEFITVCGDVHGQYYDVLNIFEINRLPSETNPYLFNGDFVDRGSFSTEVILTFLTFKLLYPKHFYLSRGNHESKAMNKVYGFEGEVKAKYTNALYDLFGEVFCALPLAHLINEKIIVLHGGLFSTDDVTLDDIRNIDRFQEPPERGLMSDILWTDPQPNFGRGPSKRGVGFAFGPDITEAFCKKNGLNLVVRSHEVKEEGYFQEHNGKLITVFSAPNYCDQMGNKGAFIKFHADDLSPKFTSFTHVPHPNIPPMAYSSPLGMMM